MQKIYMDPNRYRKVSFQGSCKLKDLQGELFKNFIYKLDI